MTDDSTIDRIQSCLERLNTAGDASARDELIRLSYGRLDALIRRIFQADDRLKGWEQTDDVRQNAAMRLWKSLEQVRPTTAEEFFGLAATQIRRELIDMARHYYGERGQGQRTAPIGLEDAPEAGETTHDPQRLAAWTEFHEAVEALPAGERQLVDLLWYHGLPQEDVARQLGVDPSTVKRRWRALRVKLYRAVQGWEGVE